MSMTVQELILKLSTYPQNLEVAVTDISTPFVGEIVDVVSNGEFVELGITLY